MGHLLISIRVYMYMYLYDLKNCSWLFQWKPTVHVYFYIVWSHVSSNVASLAPVCSRILPKYILYYQSISWSKWYSVFEPHIFTIVTCAKKSYWTKAGFMTRCRINSVASDFWKEYMGIGKFWNKKRYITRLMQALFKNESSHCTLFVLLLLDLVLFFLYSNDRRIHFCELSMLVACHLFFFLEQMCFCLIGYLSCRSLTMSCNQLFVFCSPETKGQMRYCKSVSFVRSSIIRRCSV